MTTQLEKCVTVQCHRLSRPGLDGHCLGCFFIQVLQPARVAYVNANAAFRAAITTTSKINLEGEINLSKLHSINKTKEI